MTTLDRAVKFVTEMMDLSRDTFYSPNPARGESRFSARTVLHTVLTTTFDERSIEVEVTRFGGLTGADIAAILKSAETYNGKLTMTTSGGANVSFA